MGQSQCLPRRAPRRQGGQRSETQLAERQSSGAAAGSATGTGTSPRQGQAIQQPRAGDQPQQQTTGQMPRAGNSPRRERLGGIDRRLNAPAQPSQRQTSGSHDELLREGLARVEIPNREVSRSRPHRYRAPIIREALSMLGSYLPENTPSITMIVVGGARLVLEGIGRQATHDVNYLLAPGTTEQQKQSLATAAAQVATAMRGFQPPLSSGWLHVSRTDFVVYEKQAVSHLVQHGEVFHSPYTQRLRILQAPLEYGLSETVEKINKTPFRERRRFDYDDAADYLNALMLRHGSEVLRLTWISERQREYHFQPDTQTIIAVEQYLMDKYEHTVRARMPGPPMRV
jgi:hypothetical protein